MRVLGIRFGFIGLWVCASSCCWVVCYFVLFTGLYCWRFVISFALFMLFFMVGGVLFLFVCCRFTYLWLVFLLLWLGLTCGICVVGLYC